jgi:PhnB protein
MRLYTHINFGGDCEEAFRFYEKHLGGKITMIMHKDELPPGADRPPGPPSAVIHVNMDVAGGQLIGNDVPAEVFKPIRSSYLYLSVDSSEEAERIYNAFAEGGEVTIKMQETFFATRFVQLRDKFGVLWTILHQKQ